MGGRSAAIQSLGGRACEEKERGRASARLVSSGEDNDGDEGSCQGEKVHGWNVVPLQVARVRRGTPRSRLSE